MPETPDFLTIALRVITDLEAITDGVDVATLPVSEAGAQTRQMMAVVAEQLRLTWNARGAVDVAAVQAELLALLDLTFRGSHVKQVDQAIRKLDR